jgi:hypothetical protein
MITWIRNINLPQYRSLLGENAKIIETSGDYSEVQFDVTSLQIWVECGYWHGWPNKLTKLLHRIF